MAAPLAACASTLRDTATRSLTMQDVSESAANKVHAPITQVFSGSGPYWLLVRESVTLVVSD
ncbi:hypothetical protein [Congregibacter sp.]|uniref:hypothetical protein n=1 Tax=Congregibacter sp. TaxID=2744308 RepID=UPI00385E0CC2